VRNHYCASVSICGVAANVIAVNMRIDYEVDRSTGNLCDCFNQSRANGFDAVVNKNNLIIADKQSDIATSEAVSSLN
jgi:hypothetical protein